MASSNGAGQCTTARLDALASSEDEGDEYPADSGRLGPRDVCMSACGSGGLLCHRRLESTSNFGSAIANVGVVRGKWMYEVSLWTGGIQQLGWATMLCPFTNEEGVGDTRDSYAFDGKRVRKWNKRAQQYGKAWTAGDIVGVCIDLDSQQVSFHLNGESLGVAFPDVRLFQSHLAYFPAVSLSLGESCSVNLGSAPFRFPVEGFQPLQKPPPAHLTSQCSYLLQCLERLVEVDTRSSGEGGAREKAAASSDQAGCTAGAPTASTASSPKLRPADNTLLAGCIAQHLGELLLDEHTVEAALLPFLLRLHGHSEFHDVTRLQRILAVMLAVLEDHELDAAMQTALACLGARSATASLQGQQLPYSGSYPFVALAGVLIGCPRIARAWVKSAGFHDVLEQLLTVKQPSQRDLEALLPQVHLPGCASMAQNEVAMQNKVSMLRAAMSKIEERQLMLLRTLARVPGAGVIGCNRSTKAPPQSAFTVFCHHLIRKNVGVTRQIQPHGLSDNSVLVSTFYAVLSMIGRWMISPSLTQAAAPDARAPEAGDTLAAGTADRSDTAAAQAESFAPHGAHAPGAPGADEAGAPRNTMLLFPAAELFVPPRSCAPDPYLGFNRVGGVLGEVLKLKLEDWERADVDMSAWLPLCFEGARQGGADADDADVLLEPSVQPHYLLDLAMMLYVVGLQVTYKWTSHHAQSLSLSLAALAKQTKRVQDALAGGMQPSTATFAKLKRDEREAMDAAAEHVRLAAWLHKVYVHGGSKRQACINLITYVANLLAELNARPNLWSHVAESYVECTLATFHALQRSASSPTEVLPEAAVRAILRMLVKLLNDKRVVSPYMKEVMLSSVNLLFSHSGYLRLVENYPLAVQHLVPELLDTYSQEVWMQLSTILTRLLEGTGFGNAPDPAKGSAPLRGRLACVCLQRTPGSVKFVNQLFGSLNWAITELTVTLRDVDSAQQALQRRQNVLFEFAVHSCRMLEFLFVHAPALFLTGPHINAARLCEMLAFVVSHIDAKEGSQGMRHLTAVLRSDASKLHPLHLLAPVVGVLMCAWHLEFKGGLSAAVAQQRELQAQVGFPGEAADVPDAIEHSVVHMLANMKEACSTERLETLAGCAWAKAFAPGWEATTSPSGGLCYDDFLAWVRQWREAGGDVAEAVPDDFLDPIMMCVMEDPVILPDSKVSVDRSTIVRHLLGSETDPFSRAPLSIADVVPDDDLRLKLHAWRAARAASLSGTLPSSSGAFSSGVAAVVDSAPLETAPEREKGAGLEGDAPE